MNVFTPRPSDSIRNSGWRRALTVVTAVALMFGASLVGAAPASAAPTFSISGTVTNTAGGAAIDSVGVYLFPQFSATDGGDFEPLDDEESNSQGKFSFTGVAPGTYRVYFETEGRDFLSQYFGDESGDSNGEGTPIVVDDSDVDVSQALTVGASVSGHVENSAGVPLKDITVYALPASDDDSDYYYDVEDYTNSNGDFSISGLNPDDYLLYIYSEDANYAGTSVELGQLHVSDEIEIDDVTLAVGAKLTGVVRDIAGKPLTHATISARGVDKNGFGIPGTETYGSSNKFGVYKLEQLPVGDVQVAVSSYSQSGYSIDYAGGSTTPYLSVPVKVTAVGSSSYRDIRLAATASLAGTVKQANGKIAANVRVIVIQNDADADFQLETSDGTAAFLRGAESRSASTVSAHKAARSATAAKFAALEEPTPALKSVASVRTGKDGKYVIFGLTPGSYSVIFGDNSSGGVPGATAVKSVYLPAKRTPLSVRLAKTVSASGVVKTTAGKLLAGATVEAFRVGGGSNADAVADSFGSRIAYTNKSGKYSLGLPSGTWVIKASSDVNLVSSRYVGGGTYPSASNTTKLVVKSAPIVKNVVLPLTGANVSASIISAEGLKSANGPLTLERLYSGKVVDSETFYADDWDSWEEYTSGFNAAFPLRRLADGDYRLTLSPFSYYDTWTVEPTAVTFTVASAKVTKIDGAAVTPRSSLGTIQLETPVAVVPQQLEVSIVADSGLNVGNIAVAETSNDIDEDYASYIWTRDGHPITGANYKEYRIQPSDLGTELQVLVSVFGELSNPEALSAPTPPVGSGTYPVAAKAPTLTGSGRVGSTLKASTLPGAPSKAKFSYQWFINGTPLPGATTNTFVVRIADVTDSLSVAVKANGGPAVTSAPVLVRTGSVITTNAKVTTKVSGKAGTKPTLGTTLVTASSGIPANTSLQSYQWQVNRGAGWVNLTGKTAASLTVGKVASADYAVGYSYRVLTTIERSATTTGPGVTSSSLKLVKK